MGTVTEQNADDDQRPEADGDLLADTELTPDGETSGRYHATIAEAWLVFQTFGGYSFSIAHRAALEHLDRPDLAPVAASAVFCTSIPPGPVTVDVEVLRDGRTAAQVVADLRIPGQQGTALHLTATCGQPRDSALAFTGAVFPADSGSPEDWPPPPQPTDGDPFADIAFHRQTDYRFCIGEPPWTRDFPPGPPRAGAWTRLLKPPIRTDGSFDPVGLCVHADTIGSAMGQAVGGDKDFMVLTMDLGVRFVAEQRAPWVLQHMTGWEATDGYGSGVTELWDTDRRLLAVATQTARLRSLARGERL